MNFQLLWLDWLIVSLLWVAAAVAWIARINRRWIRAVLSTLALLAPAAVLGSFLAASVVMKWYSHVSNDWFYYSSSLFVAFLVGAFVIVRKSMRPGAGMPPAAATWGRALLSFAWFVVLAGGYMILLNMDFALRARLAVLSVDVNSAYLAALPAISSPTQNAAPLYERALAILKDNAEEKEIHNYPTGDHLDFDPNEPATITFLHDYASTIALLRHAGTLPGCRFDEDLRTPDINNMLPNLNGSRNMANVLDLDAREREAHGDAATAIADIAAIYGMSRHIGQRPLLVSGLVGLGIGAIADNELQEALPIVKRSDDLSTIDFDALLPPGQMMQQCLRGEERFGLLLSGNMPMGFEAVGGKAPTLNTRPILAVASGVQGAFFRIFFLDADSYIQYMEKLQDVVIEPYHQIGDSLNDPALTAGHRGLFTSMIAPPMSRALQTVATVEANEECARTAVAMTRYRLDHGALPSKLSDLVPTYMDAILEDPFNGQPLRLVIKNGKWIIYSVGPDGVDNGGVEMDKDHKGDVIFTLAATPKP